MYLMLLALLGVNLLVIAEMEDESMICETPDGLELLHAEDYQPQGVCELFLCEKKTTLHDISCPDVYPIYSKWPDHPRCRYGDLVNVSANFPSCCIKTLQCLPPEKTIQDKGVGKFVKFLEELYYPFFERVDSL